MKRDPRDQRFYALHKKDVSHAQPEIVELVSYCNEMLEYVGAKKARRAWVELKSKLEALAPE